MILSVLALAGCAVKKKPLGFHALKINGQFVDAVIFQEEYNKYFENFSKNSRIMRMTDDEREAEVLQKVIDREITENYITNRKDIVVTDQEAADFLNHYIKPGMYMDIDEDEPVPLSYRDVVVSQAIFYSVKPYLMRMKIIPELAGKYHITVSQKEIKDEYNRQLKNNYLVIGRHIVLPNGQMELANELAEKMKKESDVADLVQKYSIDADAKDKGGVMGNIANAPITPDFPKKMLNVRPREIIKPIQLKYGIEIIRIDDVLQFNHTEDEIGKSILMNKFYTSPAYHDWVETLKSGNNIEVVDPVFKAYDLYKTGKYAEAAPLFIKLYQTGKARDKLDMAVDSFKKSGDGIDVVHWSEEGVKAFPAFRWNYYLSQAVGFMMQQKTNDCLLAMKNAEKAAGDEILKEITDQYFALGLTNEGSRYSSGGK